jgi:arsenate reductase-like glutaredoxin family protein
MSQQSNGIVITASGEALKNPLLQDLYLNPIVAKRPSAQPKEPEPQPDAPQAAPPVIAIIEPPEPEITPDFGTETELEDEPPPEEPNVAQELLDAMREEKGEKKGKSPELNMAEMRKIKNELSSQVDTLTQELETTKRQLESYTNGEVVPEVLQQKDAEIQELSRYRDLHNLKLSPEFKAKYIDPIKRMNAEATQFAKDAGFDPRVLDMAYNAPNKKEMQNILTKHMDAVSALEARQMLDSIRDLSAQAVAAEQEPAQALETMRQDAIRQEELQTAERIKTVQRTTKDSWAAAIKELRDSTTYPEITLQNNAEHDLKVVQPILTTASQELGKLVVELTKHGLKELPPHIGKVLAKTFTLAHTAAVMAESRAQHYQRAEQAVAGAKRISSMVRPQIGARTSMPAPAPRATKAPVSVEEKAENLLAGVLGRR